MKINDQEVTFNVLKSIKFNKEEESETCNKVKIVPCNS